MNKILSALIALLFTLPASGFEFWVSTTGTDPTNLAECAAIDSNNPAAGIPAINDVCGLYADDIVTFKAGTYTLAAGHFQTNGVDPRFNFSGEPGHPVTVRGDPASNDASTETYGTLFVGNFGATFGDDIKFKDFDVQVPAGQTGSVDIFVVGKNNIVFDGVRIRGQLGDYTRASITRSVDCLKISGDVFISNIQFINGYLRDCQEDAVDVVGNGDILIADTVMTDVYHAGQFKGGVEGVTVRDVTVQNTTYGFRSGSVGCEFQGINCANLGLLALPVSDRYHAKDVVFENVTIDDVWKNAFNFDGWKNVVVSNLNCTNCSGTRNTAEAWYAIINGFSGYMSFFDTASETFFNDPANANYIVDNGCVSTIDGTTPCWKIKFPAANVQIINSTINTNTLSFVDIATNSMVDDDNNGFRFYNITWNLDAGTKRWRYYGVTTFTDPNNFPVGQYGPCGEGSYATDTNDPTPCNTPSLEGVTDTTITVGLTGGTDTVGVTERCVYNNGILAGCTANATYEITGLTQSTTYANIRATARDAAGNESVLSDPLSATTAATGALLWEPTFIENFNGSTLRPGAWKYRTVNNDKRLVAYDSSACSVSGGNLVLSLINQPKSDRPYVGCGVETQGIVKAGPGSYWEIRAQLPNGIGNWSAFWTFPESGVWNSEADILEQPGSSPNNSYHAWHYNQSQQNQWSFEYDHSPTDLTAGFHVYSLLWTDTVAEMRVDGTLVWELDSSIPAEAAAIAEFVEDMFAILNRTAPSCTSGWDAGQCIDATTDFNEDYLVDYVRIYEQQPGGTYATIPAWDTAIADTTPVAYDNTAASIEWTGPQNTIVRAPQSVQVLADVTAHKANLSANLSLSLLNLTADANGTYSIGSTVSSRNVTLAGTNIGDVQAIDTTFGTGITTVGMYVIQPTIKNSGEPNKALSNGWHVMQYVDSTQPNTSILMQGFFRTALASYSAGTVTASAAMQIQTLLMVPYIDVLFEVLDGTTVVATDTVRVEPDYVGLITVPTTLSVTLTPGSYSVRVSAVDSSTNFTIPALTTPFTAPGAANNAVGTCTEGDEALASRGDILFCEPFNSQTWVADHGYVDGQSPTPSAPLAGALNRVSIVNSSECLSGSCLEGDWAVAEERVLAIVWPVKAANAADSSFAAEPDELYMRYYLKFGPNWNANQISGAEGNGKLFGFADGRENGDPGDQCGNGGATPDGTDCWTARGIFHVCEDIGGANGWAPDATCGTVPNRKARIGSYIYANGNANQVTGATGVSAIWDGFGENQGRGTTANGTNCRRAGPPGTPEHIASCYNDNPDNYYAGLGKETNVAALDWMAIETYVKMNTPGVGDGVLRGWIDGQLVYDKTDVIWRQPGHDNLHVRTVWLDMYKGGTSGNTTASKSWVDQMVVSTNYIGPMGDPIAAMPPGTWYEVPNSEMNDFVDSCNPRNCSYSGNSGFAGITNAWSSGALDTTRNKMLIFGGGHGDYGGNEVPAFDLDTFTWELITQPSAADLDTSPTYPDGNPVSRHTYDMVQYSPELDSLLAFGNGSGFPDSQPTDKLLWRLTQSGTPTWSQLATVTTTGLTTASTAHDTATGDFYWFPGDTGPVGFYDTSANTWTNSGNFSGVIHQTSAMDPTRKKVLRMGNDFAWVYDLSTPGTPTRVDLNSVTAYTSSDTDNLDQHDMPGLVYHAGLDKWVWWNFTSGAAVYLIDPDTYAIEKRDPSAGNTVIPLNGATPAIGVNGRFRYSESLGVFVLVTSTERNVWLYKPDLSI